jgi:hypothetical protein
MEIGYGIGTHYNAAIAPKCSNVKHFSVLNQAPPKGTEGGGEILGDAIASYYQICMFPNDAGKYGTRVVFFDSGTGEVKDFRERQLTELQVKKLQQRLPQRAYRMWQMKSLNLIPFPQQSTFMSVTSPLLQ